ncbi:MAG TPA: phage tail sheath subtilisin-like domain-containing protein [Nitrososphaerales archaeon]|nr:phage tail sheath subtilisin-like domain-containing protein [Nitrososphaerales archaeon]
MARVIPGVEIKVVKEIVPQALYPSGVVGMIGTAEGGPVLKPTGVTSYRELASIFGGESGSLVRDAKLAFLNGVFQVYATRIEGTGGTMATATLSGARKRATVKLTSKISGEAGNDTEVVVMRGQTEDTVRVEITNDKNQESFDNLTMKPGTELSLVDFLNKNSKLVAAEDLKANLDFPANNPVDVEVNLSGGVSQPPTKDDYQKALEMLEMEPEVDAVYACDSWDPAVHAMVDAHCKNMSTDCKNRIGFGTVGPNEPVDDILKRVDVLASDRFVIAAPYGIGGAVAGLISKLSYWESPTFKALTGIANIEHRYTPSEQMKLISNGILPVDAVRGRGLIVVKGITSSKEQISVMRVADHAVRGVKNVADNFIGTLNNDRGRTALREALAGFLTGMEKEGSLVPSVDGKSPAFLVDVYSSQTDFAQGIVRADVAVRPVRAMDYIYATLTVEA